MYIRSIITYLINNSINTTRMSSRSREKFMEIEFNWFDYKKLTAKPHSLVEWRLVATKTPGCKVLRREGESNSCLFRSLSLNRSSQYR
jgi:hypothetical protein